MSQVLDSVQRKIQYAGLLLILRYFNTDNYLVFVVFILTKYTPIMESIRLPLL